MLSAESAAGAWPVESATMMDSIADAIERDPAHGDRVHFTVLKPDPTPADALSEAAKTIPTPESAAAITCFTSSGSTARPTAHEPASVPPLMMTPSLDPPRRAEKHWCHYA